MFHAFPVRAIFRNWRNLRGFCGVVPLPAHRVRSGEPARRGTVDGSPRCSAMLIRRVHWRALDVYGKKPGSVWACRALRGCAGYFIGRAFRFPSCTVPVKSGRVMMPVRASSRLYRISWQARQIPPGNVASGSVGAWQALHALTWHPFRRVPCERRASRPR